MRATAIVLGATGRIGAELLPILTRTFDSVIGVARREMSSGPPEMMWTHADIQNAAIRNLCRRELAQRITSAERVVVFDLVLDRSSVRQMLSSVAASTAFARDLAADLQWRGIRTRIVAASTTAILAPGPFQTPYGQAKRDQAEQYARTPGSQLVLLPSLTQTTGNGWTFAHAAKVLAGVAIAVMDRPHTPAIAWTPADLPEPSRDGGVLRTAVAAQIRHWMCRHDDPRIHRAVTHGRLALLPSAVRRRLDHHVAPPGLVRAFGLRNGCAVAYLPHPADPEHAQRRCAATKRPDYYNHQESS